MISEIKDTHRRVEVTNVRDVVVTDIVTDEGRSKRAIRILGEPEDNGKPTEILEIVLISDKPSDIELVAPVFQF